MSLIHAVSNSFTCLSSLIKNMNVHIYWFITHTKTRFWKFDDISATSKLQNAGRYILILLNHNSGVFPHCLNFPHKEDFNGSVFYTSSNDYTEGIAVKSDWYESINGSTLFSELNSCKKDVLKTSSS